MRKALIKLPYLLKIFILRLKGINIAFSARVKTNAHLCLTHLNGSTGSINIAENCEISHGVIMKSYGGQINISGNIYLGEYVTIYGHGGVDIGPNTLISMHTCIVSSNHTIPARTELIRSKPDILMPVKIGADVWIGAGCIILGGVVIGDGAVVGAGSIVTKDIPACSIATGSPAKVKRTRI